MWYVIGLVWIAVTVVIIAKYTSKQRQRANERAQHMEQMLAELKANPRAGVGADTAKAAAAAVPVPQFSRKPRLLPAPVALLYYVFRTGLPDHEIFAGVALDEALDIAATPPAGLPGPRRSKGAAHRGGHSVVCHHA